MQSSPVLSLYQLVPVTRGAELPRNTASQDLLLGEHTLHTKDRGREMEKCNKSYFLQFSHWPISTKPLVRELRVVIVVTKKKGTMSKIMKIVTNIKVKFMTFVEVTVVTEVKLIYIQNDLVGQALAWCLQLAAERLWKPDPLAPSGLNLLLLHLLLVLLKFREFVCTGLCLFCPISLVTAWFS